MVLRLCMNFIVEVLAVLFMSPSGDDNAEWGIRNEVSRVTWLWNSSALTSYFCSQLHRLQYFHIFFSDSKRSFLIYFSQISCLIPMIFLKIQARFLLYTAYILIKTCGPLLFQSNQYQVFYLKEYPGRGQEEMIELELTNFGWWLHIIQIHLQTMRLHQSVFPIY